ncbi:hypothetical protein EXIGLDRAFT_723204 [Exidia glandulosa HHB12029]|uniref:Uncharacterized protein n=1 Tax=Exidia glandulosa HHB12029 TaxID=1314781 RepID=A0A165EXN5_EXIGL|nr:hypothetical protein EXIGLDRAFT_723204 [Exidia glandulosa HHB12029]
MSVALARDDLARSATPFTLFNYEGTGCLFGLMAPRWRNLDSCGLWVDGVWCALCIVESFLWVWDEM